MKQLEEEEKNGTACDGEKKSSEGEFGAARSESEVSDRERSVPGDEGGGVERKLGEEGLESNSDSGGERGGERGGAGVGSQERREDSAMPPSPISIVISQPEEVPGQVKISVSKSTAAESEEKIGGVAAVKKGCLPSAGRSQECRVCQQQTEEPLLDLGCRCRGELALAHRSCIELWFHTKGSNICEICLQVAANVQFPDSQTNTNYWVWMVDPAHGRGWQEHERRCSSPLWIAFIILIGGLLLDVLITVSLGVTTLPANVIFGVICLLGVGAALRLALECCHQWCSWRNNQREDMISADMITANHQHLPAIV